MTNLRPLVIAIVIGAVVNLGGSCLFVWQSYEARQTNCQNTIDAFEAYTQALAEVSGADPETVDNFRDAYRPALEECE